MDSESFDASTSQREGALPEWADPFLDLLREKRVADACRELRIDRTTPYALKKRDPEFAARWAEIQDARDDRMEDTLAERLVDGWLEPVYHNGEQIDERRVFDNKTALAYLKARRPERWSERRIDAGAGQEQQKVQIEFVQQPAVEPDTTKGSE